MSSALTPGFYDVPPGMVATVVTYLEMMAPSEPRPVPPGLSPEITPVPDMTVGTYRDLFERVGAQDWLWFSRLALPEDALAAILADPDVAFFTIFDGDTPQALLELDFRETGACELAFFGVSPSLIGTGAGRLLMNRAIAEAWARPITRFHVHTCTLDHPGALGFYRRSGFTPVGQQIEMAPDPRLAGLLPEDAGAHIPIFGGR